MKTFYLSGIFICIFSVVTYAQQKENVEFGVQGGYNLSTIDLGSATSGSSTLGGFNAGIYADIYSSYNWSFKVKLLYDQKGFEQKDILVYAVLYNINKASLPAPIQTTYHNINLNYITMPLTADWHFGYKYRWDFDFGPYIGFLLSAKDSENSVSYQDIKNQYNTIDAGLTLGIGFKLPVTKHLKLFVEYSFQNGLTNAINGPENANESYQNVRSSLDLGVSF